MPPQPTSSPSSSQPVILISALLIILFIAVFAVSSLPKRNAEVNLQNENQATQTIQRQLEIDVKKIDLTQAQGTNRLPSGFPSNIPVDTLTIYESYTAEYPTATQATVAYKTERSISDAYKVYHDYMKNAGYVFRPNGEDMEKGILYGKLLNNDLSILITQKDANTSVQMSWFKRK